MRYDDMMTKITLKSPGLRVHERLKKMVKSYGLMMSGVSAELIGQIQAERSLARIKKNGDIRQIILNEVENIGHIISEPADSCGQISNDVCELLLEKAEVAKFHHTEYEELSANGHNLKKALKKTNQLIRFEVDRASYPKTVIKIKSKDFNPDTSAHNKIYLLENMLCFIDREGTVFDLGQTEKKCEELFSAIGGLREYSICDPFTLEEPDTSEDFAICDIAKIFKAQKKRFDCWLGSHSFTVYTSQSLINTPRQFYPYQAYFGAHTLQYWLAGDKDESLSKKGIDKYIEQLVLLGSTTNTKERSDTYAQLFSTPGREDVFCAALNVRTEQLRVKFKIVEVNPNVALRNLDEVQEFIDTHQGTSAADKVEDFKNRVKTAMTQQLESLLLMKPVSSPSFFSEDSSKTVQEHTSGSAYPFKGRG